MLAKFIICCWQKREQCLNIMHMVIALKSMTVDTVALQGTD